MPQRRVEVARDISGDYSDMFGVPFRRQVPDIELGALQGGRRPVPRASRRLPGVCGHRARAGRRTTTVLGSISRRISFGSCTPPAIPFVGICFGHQILAHALGGRVANPPGGWVSAPTPSTSRVPSRQDCFLLFMHQDQVVDLPPEATVRGHSDHCPIAMFGVGPSILGIRAPSRVDRPLRRGAGPRSNRAPRRGSVRRVPWPA